MSQINIEEISFQIILHGGNARSSAMEAMQYARTGEFDKADASLIEAKVEIGHSHKFQTQLIQAEARGEEFPIKILLIHSQDHLMNAMTVIDLAAEIIEIQKRLQQN